jgi:hypothetical protein
VLSLLDPAAPRADLIAVLRWLAESPALSRPGARAAPLPGRRGRRPPRQPEFTYAGGSREPRPGREHGHAGRHRRSGVRGLPLAVRAAQVGHSVVGFDVDDGTGQAAGRR